MLGAHDDTLVSLGEWLEIERPIRTGGMGAIYRARVRASGERVALKVMNEQQPAAAARFQREARILAQLDHPGIVRYIAHGTTRTGRAFLAMEWLDGEDLSARLSRTGLTPAESVRLVRNTAEALHAAHERGVIHRDLKPSNLFLEGGSVDRVKILDFGVARLDHGSMVTRTGAILGTPAYMAPEQARGNQEVDARADFFALGCVLFKCLTGRTPFTAGHPVAVMGQIIFQEAPRLCELRPELPVRLDMLVGRLLAKNPDDRPSDARQLMAELDQLGELPGDAATECERKPSRALTDTERRLMCVILVADAVPGQQGGPTIDENQSTVILTEHADTQGDADTALDIAAAGSVLDRLCAVAREHGGQAAPLADGSVVTVFAGEGSATDLATRAAYCALSMRSVVPDAPMALATGREVLGGSLPVGDVIERQVVLLRNSETTITSTNNGCPVRLDDVTAGLLDARFDVSGDAQGLQLHGRRDFAEAPRLLLGKPTSCVGRDRELALLDEIFLECTEEPVARSVLITAPPGIGKSRLRHEFMRNLDRHEEPVEIWIAQAAPTHKARPFELLGRAMRHGVGISDEDAPAVQRRKLRARVSRHFRGATRQRVTECLGAILDIAFPDAETHLPPPSEIATRDEQLSQAFEDFLRAECETQPVVFLLEDVHWSDRTTMRYLDTALRVLRDMPFFVLATARLEVHERFPGLWFDRGVEEVRLHALRRSTCTRWVKEVLGENTPREDVKRIVQHSGGNAFFLEELMRAYAAGRGAELPPTVLAMVQARLERFPAEARRVLRAASVFGESFTRAGLLALLEGDADFPCRLGGWLRLLEEQEVIARSLRSKQGSDEYLFLHAYLREAAYAMLTDNDRALAEKLAAAWSSENAVA